MESSRPSVEIDTLFAESPFDATALFEQYEPVEPDLQASNDDNYGACENLYLVPS